MAPLKPLVDFKYKVFKNAFRPTIIEVSTFLNSTFVLSTSNKRKKTLVLDFGCVCCGAYDTTKASTF
jgi:hypothetical protein